MNLDVYKKVEQVVLPAHENKRNLQLPLKLCLAYLIFTLVVFIFGPWPWPNQVLFKVCTFMGIAISAIYIGYQRGLRRRAARHYYGRFSSLQLYRISLYLSLILFLPTLLWRTSGISINEALNNLGSAYESSHNDMLFSGKTAWIEYIRIVFQVFLNLLIPLLVVYWRRLSSVHRILGIGAIASNIFLGVVTGTNKGIGDVMILIFGSLLIANRGHVSAKTAWKALAITFPFAIVFFLIFTAGQIARNGGSVQMDLYGANISADKSNVFTRFLPPLAQEGVIAFTSYMTQGYYGLYLCLDQPFVPTWGLGNSRFTATYADKYLGTNITESTYPKRAEAVTQWDSKVHWHTIFPWLASDFTFPGAVLVIGLFSYLFAMSWRDSLSSENPYAFSLFLQLTTMFVYLSANNQVLQGDRYVGFWLTILAWYFTRKKIIY